MRLGSYVQMGISTPSIQAFEHAGHWGFDSSRPATTRGPSPSAEGPTTPCRTGPPRLGVVRLEKGHPSTPNYSARTLLGAQGGCRCRDAARLYAYGAHGPRSVRKYGSFHAPRFAFVIIESRDESRAYTNASATRRSWERRATQVSSLNVRLGRGSCFGRASSRVRDGVR